MLARRPGQIIPAPIAKSLRPAPAPANYAVASPLERNPKSPKGWKKREADGVGLGIVAALERARPRTSHPSKIVVIAQKPAPTAVAPPPRTKVSAATEDFPVADFLSHCNLCGKKLHGKDIYMYRGEKAFCSMECRYQQIVSDEHIEKCGSRVLRPTENSSSACSGGRRRLFFTGIMAS